MKSLMILGVFGCITNFGYTQKLTYASLYKIAFEIGRTRPDSAIFYAQKAMEKTKSEEEKSNAHQLIAYNAQRMGYYGLAIIHYKKAANLNIKTNELASLMNNIATCYKSAGNPREAISIGKKVVKHFAESKDSVQLSYSLTLLANCYRDLANYYYADSLFRLSIQISKQKVPQNLANVYHDFARLKARLGQYKTSIHYQKLSIKTLNKKTKSRKKIQLTQLARLYFFAQKPDSAQYYLQEAQTIKSKIPKASIYFQATKGLLHFFNRNEAQAKIAYQKCDSLLGLLKLRSNHLVQKKYARKTAYEVYQSAYKILDNLWFYSNDKERFTKHRKQFKQRVKQEKELFEEIKIQVSLRDSLVIARTAPKTQVIRQVNPWWWMVLVIVLMMGGLLIYQRRVRALKAHSDFVKALETSPLKGFENPNAKEIAMLEKVEKMMGNKLKLDDIKVIMMISRSYNYNQIGLALAVPPGTIKTRVKRIKDKCGVENIRDLM